jgi:chromosome partitioning protein
MQAVVNARGRDGETSRQFGVGRRAQRSRKGRPVLVAALLNADHLLSPIELETYSAQGIQKTLALLDRVRGGGNAGLDFIGMVASKVDGRSQYQATAFADLVGAYPSLMVPHSIGLRACVPQVAWEQIPVWRVQKTPARKSAKDMRAIAPFVIVKINARQEV